MHDGVSPGTLGARLRGARRRRFVGRFAELELVRAALTGGEPEFAVLFVHAPGGVGKTALLEALADEAVRLGIPAWRVDLRDVERSPAGVLGGVAAALDAPDAATALARLRGAGRAALLLDTYESAAGLDDWIRDEFLPQVGEQMLVVIAGREPPGSAWLADPGWRELLRVVSLRNLAPDDSRALLQASGVDEALHERALELTHGHPLALSLLVDVLRQRGEEEAADRLDLRDAPDCVRALLARFVADVPSARHRVALEICAHARVTTEDLLREAIGCDDAGALFAWLRTLSIIEEGREGVFPHDVARDVLDLDLRWRDRAAYAQMHRQVRRYVVQRIRTTAGREQQRATADLHFLHRANPGIRPFYDWDSLGKHYIDELRAGDEEAVVEMVQRHETPESAALARFWLERQPQAFAIFRDAAGPAPIGFAAILALHEASADEIAADPGTAAMWAYALAHGAPRPGDEVFAGRFFMDAEAYQTLPSPSFNLIGIHSVQHYVRRPRLAWDFIGIWGDADGVAPFMNHIDYHRAAEADYEVGGRRYGVFAHDWRRMPLEPWLELMEGREIADEPGRATSTAAPAALPLSHPEFADAVRRALRDLHRPEALAANPLTRARVVGDRSAADPPAEVLEALLREAVAALAADPRADSLHRALDRTYVRPAPSQEKAAELLGVPLSSFRRHLARGCERVTEWLWQRELYGPG